MKFPSLGILLGVLTLSPVADAADSIIAPVPGERSQVQLIVTGVIRKVTATELIFQRDDGQGDAKVTLNKTVLITKAEKPAAFEDLIPGVRVKITARRASMEAVSIEIVTPNPKLPLDGKP